MKYLALYTGPSGPISATFEAPTDRAAQETIKEHAVEWYDTAADALDLDPNSPTLEADIEQALALGGWGVVQEAATDSNYTLYIQSDEEEFFSALEEALDAIDWQWLHSGSFWGHFRGVAVRAGAIGDTAPTLTALGAADNPRRAARVHARVRTLMFRQARERGEPDIKVEP